MTDDLLLGAAHFAGAPADLPVDVVAARPPAVASRRAAAGAPGPASEARVKPLSEAVAELEGRAIREAMLATRGNKLAASRLLGISRATLYEKLALQQRGTREPAGD